MMKQAALIAGIAGSVVLLGACASQGGSKPAAPAAVAKVAAPAPASQQASQKTICISGTPTGSHIARVVCLSQAQYQAEQEQLAKARGTAQKMILKAPNPRDCKLVQGGC